MMCANLPEELLMDFFQQAEDLCSSTGAIGGRPYYDRFEVVAYSLLFNINLT